MDSADIITLESDALLSQSQLWAWEETYYKKSGMNAWTGAVPFFATSNTFIANAYAQVIINYIRDQIQSAPDNFDQPFYVLELGAGSGRFAFYCAKRLLELKKQLAIPVDLCYVMTDFVHANLAFWRQQTVLHPLFEAGILDQWHYLKKQ